VTSEVLSLFRFRFDRIEDRSQGIKGDYKLSLGARRKRAQGKAGRWAFRQLVSSAEGTENPDQGREVEKYLYLAARRLFRPGQPQQFGGQA
jgi:hypothetical protein